MVSAVSHRLWIGANGVNCGRLSLEGDAEYLDTRSVRSLVAASRPDVLLSRVLPRDAGVVSVFNQN